ncbi:hypothetical protein ACFX2A_015958 [Malus domestica]
MERKREKEKPENGRLTRGGFILEIGEEKGLKVLQWLHFSIPTWLPEEITVLQRDWLTFSTLHDFAPLPPPVTHLSCFCVFHSYGFSFVIVRKIEGSFDKVEDYCRAFWLLKGVSTINCIKIVISITVYMNVVWSP